MKLTEVLEMLGDAVDQVKTSEHFREFLRFMSRMHKYSFWNQLLIWLAKPDATYVAGYKRWQELGRQVRKGERGIQILAPLIYSVTVTDPETGEEKAIPGVRGFRWVTVFDVSQTDGKPVPELARPLVGESEAAQALYDHLLSVAAGLEIPVTQAPSLGGAHGLYHQDRRTIQLLASDSLNQKAKTLAHELAHAILHPHYDATISREVQELEAEATAYVVASFFGLDTHSYSLDYLASWGADRDAILASGSRIQQAVKTLLGEQARDQLAA